MAAEDTMLTALHRLGIITEIEESWLGPWAKCKITLHPYPSESCKDRLEITHQDTTSMHSVKCYLFRHNFLEKESLPKHIILLAEKVANGPLTDVKFSRSIGDGYSLEYRQGGIPFGHYMRLGYRWQLYQNVLSSVRAIEEIDKL